MSPPAAAGRAAELGAGLDARFLLVVGKGGVGKTTTAGALALGLADLGSSTHLLSTDPAHSLGDLFRRPLPPGQPTPSGCSDRLTLEELDASAILEGWIARVREPLLEVLDRGTYLDRDDAAGFLDLSLPGVDEVAAVLRLAELAEGPDERIVVDTAPTGHTLRLLDAGGVVRGWAEAFDAMAEKASVVLSHLTRRSIRMAAEDVVDELMERMERFDAAVLAGALSVLVERRGTLVEAETRRLHDALRERGVGVGLRIRTGEGPVRDGPGPTASQGAEPTPVGALPTSPEGARERVVKIPLRDDLRGCQGLRAWGSPPPPAPHAPRDRRQRSPAAPRLLRMEADLLLLVGKGGVGKTTCAAALAVALAADRPVGLLGTDPAGSLGDVLDARVDPDGTVRFAAGEGRDLTVRETEATAAFARFREGYRDEVARAFEGIGLGRSAVLDRRVVSSLLALAPPGADEVFALLALLEDGRPGRTLVVDTAPTGHFLRLLEMPDLALQWTRQLMRVLLKYRAALGLDDLAERLLLFAKQLKELNLRLTDPARSAAVVVTLSGALVEAETGRLLHRLRAARVPVGAVVLNRYRGGDPAADLSDGGETLRVLAPERDDPPVGGPALADFFDSWRLA